MYARGLTTREISEQIEDIYGFEASAQLISRVTDKIIPQIEDWQNRRLAEVYPLVVIDALMFSVRRDKIVQKVAVYVVLGVDADGMKDVLSIEIGENESAKFWLSVLNNLKHRGVKDILMLCADGLSGIKEAIDAAYPMTEYQQFIWCAILCCMCLTSTKRRLQPTLKRYTTPQMKPLVMPQCLKLRQNGTKSTQMQ